MGDLDKYIKKPKKKAQDSKKTVKVIERKKVGRKADWGDTETVRTSVTLPIETYEAIQLALATTHKGTKTQNRLINAAILAFLDEGN